MQSNSVLTWKCGCVHTSRVRQKETANEFTEAMKLQAQREPRSHPSVAEVAEKDLAQEQKSVPISAFLLPR